MPVLRIEHDTTIHKNNPNGSKSKTVEPELLCHFQSTVPILTVRRASNPPHCRRFAVHLCPGDNRFLFPRGRVATGHLVAPSDWRCHDNSAFLLVDASSGQDPLLICSRRLMRRGSEGHPLSRSNQTQALHVDPNLAGTSLPSLNSVS